MRVRKYLSEVEEEKHPGRRDRRQFGIRHVHNPQGNLYLVALP